MFYSFINEKRAEKKYNQMIRRLKYVRIIDCLDDHKELLKATQVRYNQIFCR